MLSCLPKEWVRRTNRAIFDAGSQAKQGRRMGSTLAGFVLRGDMGVVVHVGDSRVYRLRDGRLH